MVGETLTGSRDEFRRIGDPGAVRARSLRRALSHRGSMKFTHAARVEGRSR
jgi:hypothetical protein